MYRADGKYILTEIQGYEAGGFSHSANYGGKIFEAYLDDNTSSGQYLTIPKSVLVLNSDSIVTYDIHSVIGLYDDGTIRMDSGVLIYKLSKRAKYMLNDEGKAIYTMYSMMYKDDDIDNNWIDINEFIEKYTCRE